MYTVYTTLNNNLTKDIFYNCLLKNYDVVVSLLYENSHRYNNQTYLRVFGFVWQYGIKEFYKVLLQLNKSIENQLELIHNKQILRNINKLIQYYKSKGGVLQ